MEGYETVYDRLSHHVLSKYQLAPFSIVVLLSIYSSADPKYPKNVPCESIALKKYVRLLILTEPHL